MTGIEGSLKELFSNSNVLMPVLCCLSGAILAGTFWSGVKYLKSQAGKGSGPTNNDQGESTILPGHKL